jgi:hypothetical protein
VFSRAGEPVHLLAILEAHWHSVRLCQPDDRLYTVPVAASRDHDTVQRTPCRERFFDRMESSHPVHVLVLASGAEGRLVQTNRGNCVRCDGFAASDFTSTFVRFCFQVDFAGGNAQGFRQGGTHGWKMRPEFGTFADHDCIYMYDSKPAISKHFANVLKEDQA